MGAIHQQHVDTRTSSRREDHTALLAIHDARLRTSKTLEVRSDALRAGEPMPRQFTVDGQGVSPPLRWSGVPEGTQELVLLCEDPDAPMPTPFVHWIVYGLRPETESLPESSAQSRTLHQGRNSARKTEFMPAAPPPGHGTHRYHFQLFAIDEPLRFTSAPDRNEVVTSMSGHVLASGELVVPYSR
jgi:Raf kinase inhibitor-like YbhB/YbcL family protein